MIYTVTCNPALDYALRLPALEPGRVNRAAAARLSAGGKGINVARVLRALGVPATALSFRAGTTGRALEAALAEEGLAARLIALPAGQTRINVKVHAGAGPETELNAPGPALTADALALLEQALAALGPGDGLVLAGSVPPDTDSGLYGRLAALAEERGAFAAVDAEGPLLLRALAARPLLIKPNHQELGALFGCTVASAAQAYPLARRLQEAGARHVLVSLGAAGAALLDEEGGWHTAPAPRGEARSAVGAGDAMVAGFLAAWLAGAGAPAALCRAVAAGSAAAFFGGAPDAQHVARLEAAVRARLATGGESEYNKSGGLCEAP